MYLSEESLYRIVTTIIQEAGKLSNLSSGDKNIHVKYTRHRNARRFYAHLRRFQPPQQTRILVMLCQGKKYPQDVIEIIKEENRYIIVTTLSDKRETYTFFSLNGIMDSVMVKRLVDDFFTYLLDR